MKNSIAVLLIILGMIGNVNATNIGGAGYLSGDVRDEISPCHEYVIDTWFTGNVVSIIDGRGIMAERKEAGKLGFTVDDLLYISMLKIMDSALAYKEALHICGLHDK